MFPFLLLVYKSTGAVTTSLNHTDIFNFYASVSSFLTLFVLGSLPVASL